MEINAINKYIWRKITLCGWSSSSLCRKFLIPCTHFPMTMQVEFLCFFLYMVHFVDLRSFYLARITQKKKMWTFSLLGTRNEVAVHRMGQNAIKDFTSCTATSCIICLYASKRSKTDAAMEQTKHFNHFAHPLHTSNLNLRHVWNDDWD